MKRVKFFAAFFLTLKKSLHIYRQKQKKSRKMRNFLPEEYKILLFLLQYITVCALLTWKNR